MEKQSVVSELTPIHVNGSITMYTGREESLEQISTHVVEVFPAVEFSHHDSEGLHFVDSYKEAGVMKRFLKTGVLSI